jgi:hypothetical protein
MKEESLLQSDCGVCQDSIYAQVCRIDIRRISYGEL